LIIFYIIICISCWDMNGHNILVGKNTRKKNSTPTNKIVQNTNIIFNLSNTTLFWTHYLFW